MMTIYRGDNNVIDIKDYNILSWLKDKGEIWRAFAEWPWIYFSSYIEDAKKYWKYIFKSTINNGWFFDKTKKTITKDLIKKIILKSPEIETSVSNYNENFNVWLNEIIGICYDCENDVDIIQTIWAEAFWQSHLSFLETMIEFSINWLIIEKIWLIHIIVFNKKSIISYEKIN